MQPFASEILLANRTARGAGAVGDRAVVPLMVMRWALRGQTILDFGAGPQARHTLAMRALGLDATAHDIGANFDPALHDPSALSRTYDIVLASNVLSTAGSDAFLHRTLTETVEAVAPGGILFANLPASPRKAAWPRSKADGDAMLDFLLRRLFRRVQRLPSGFWACRERLA